MTNRLSKQGVLALIIYFLMITAVSTPIAFYAGKARGADKARPNAAAGASLSQNETDAGNAGPPISLALAPEMNAAGASGSAGSSAPGLRIGPRAPSRKPAALRDAVMRAIAGGPSPTEAPEGAEPLPAPFSLAMAPDLAAGLLGGTANGPVGYPGAIIPGFLSSPSAPPPQNPGPGPGPDNPTPPDPGGPGGETPEVPPVIVTPVPAALPLLITGFAALFAVRKRARA